MRRLIVLLLLALITPEPAPAQSGAIDILCAECRDPLEYPDDWVNFAFNQVYGESGWLDFEQADDFFLVNLDGIRVYVDVDFVMDGINLLGNTLPLWPTNLLQITVALPNGVLYTALRSVFLTPLPVPSPAGPVSGRDTGGSAGDESGDDGADDPEYDHDEEFELPDFEYTGVTGIEDPDEDGEFPGTDWCEEC